jgi:hypothetical protein
MSSSFDGRNFSAVSYVERRVPGLYRDSDEQIPRANTGRMHA